MDNKQNSGFQQTTITNVINPLRKILDSKRGTFYPSLGHFYREIEVLKFPYTKRSVLGSYLNPVHGRNVYGQQQYDTIKDLMVAEGRITIIPNPNRNGYFIVIVR
jgi:hypothetical protein